MLVNAGICLARENTPIDADVEDFVAMMVTNALSPMRVVESFEDRVPPGGIIAVMSSELGSIAGNRGFWELYSASKAALNMLMKCFSQRHPDDPRAMLSDRARMGADRDGRHRGRALDRREHPARRHVRWKPEPASPA